MSRVFVFGYGSLAAQIQGPPSIASITGFVRTWDVAMDNLAQIPGYKYYVDPATGERPAVHVTFLNLTPEAHTDTVGFLIPVTPTTLAELDHRERNYDRVEVTDHVTAETPLRTRVYTYLGTPEARERAAAPSAVIAQRYITAVEQAYQHAGLSEGYLASTRPPTVPVRELTRVNLPAVLPAPWPAVASAPRTAPPGTRSPRR